MSAAKKRLHSEIFDHEEPSGATPDAKRPKLDNVQLIASSEEIEDRITKLIDQKQQEMFLTVQKEFLTEEPSVEHGSSRTIPKPSDKGKKIAESAVTNTEGAKFEPTNRSHINSEASLIPNVHFVEQLPPGLPPVIEERFQTLERHLYTNLSVRSVPSDVYRRLKMLEDRVLALEKQGIYPQRNASAPVENPSNTNQIGNTSNLPLTDAASNLPGSVDDRIRELHEKLAAQATQVSEIHH